MSKKVITGILDKQTSTIYFYDEDLSLVRTYSGDLNLPYDAYYQDDRLYVADGANHLIRVLGYYVQVDPPKFTDIFTTLSRQLYPTGRAFVLPLRSIFTKFHEGLALSESRAFEFLYNIYNSLIPDNDQFTENDADRWIEVLGLFRSRATTLGQKKQAIMRKLKFPGTDVYRQTGEYLQAQLQEAGFDVFVDGTTPIVSDTLHGEFNHGDRVFGGIEGIEDYTIIANFISETRDEEFVDFPNADVNYRFGFTVGGENPLQNNRANVPKHRKQEFRELILKIKPAHSFGVLLVDYV